MACRGSAVQIRMAPSHVYLASNQSIMAVGKDIENRSHIKGFKEEIDKIKKKNDIIFWDWFDQSNSKDTSFIRGSWDFSFHIANRIAKYIRNPESKISLDYGHGGGRMLDAACRHFKFSYG